MSYRYRSQINEANLPSTICVEVGNEVFAFATAADAAAAFSALDRAVGVRRWEKFTKPGTEHTDHEYAIVPLKSDGLKLERRQIAGVQDTLDAITWVEETKCDGTGVCGCWRAQTGHTTPEDWQEYEHEGVTKHMCSECQNKTATFTPPKLSC